MLVPYKHLLPTFADPTIMLFLVGFILAMAAIYVGLDIAIARVLLKPFGTKSEYVLLPFLLIMGFFLHVHQQYGNACNDADHPSPRASRTLPKDGKGSIALALPIPAGANIGGIGTPIGTPPSAFALEVSERAAWAEFWHRFWGVGAAHDACDVFAAVSVLAFAQEAVSV